jgi:hypothetical protein
MSDTKRAPDGVLCSARCPLLRQGYCMEMGVSRAPGNQMTGQCIPELDDIKSAYAKKCALAKTNVAAPAPPTCRSTKTVVRGLDGISYFDREVNELLERGWLRYGMSEVLTRGDDILLLQRLVRDVPLDEDLGGVDDSETSEQ